MLEILRKPKVLAFLGLIGSIISIIPMLISIFNFGDIIGILLGFQVGLIGYFLFELGYIDNAKKYFEYVQDIGEDNILILECKNKIENILKLYTD